MLLSVVRQETFLELKQRIFWGYFYYFGARFLGHQKTFIEKFDVLKKYRGFKSIEAFNIDNAKYTYDYLGMYL